MAFAFIALFDTIHHLNPPRPKDLPQFLVTDFYRCSNFLKSYAGNLGTFNSYRRETERLLQWCWHIKQISLKELRREEVEQYIRFCQNPPKSWISLYKYPRFIVSQGTRITNPKWRPFVATQTKIAYKQGQELSIEQFNLSQGSTQEIFAILSTLFNFLIAEEYLMANPVALMRQKSKFIRKVSNPPIRRLSLVQWQTVLKTAEELALDNPIKHERSRFILNMLYGMYLRISELAADERWTPVMNHFAKDSHNHWWFTTVGKGNKERQVAVSDEMLYSLIRWRRFLNLPDLPSAADTSPLLPKIRGTGAVGDTATIRRIVQFCFDNAVESLRQRQFTEEADNLATATVHWLRHTGISEDVKIRPREHVRDDAGHRSSVTTDRYVDVELRARHQSARNKIIKPYQE